MTCCLSFMIMHIAVIIRQQCGMWRCVEDSYVHQIGECAKRSPELIQLLELHTQFAAITPYTQVRNHLTF